MSLVNTDDVDAARKGKTQFCSSNDFDFDFDQPKFKILLQDIGEQLETRTEISRSIWMNKMRSRLMMELIFYNTKMVQQCDNLFSIEDNIDELLLDEDALKLN